MSTPEEIRAEAERHREQLAETVDELSRRLDVKTRAKERAQRLKEQATTQQGLIVLGGTGVAVTALVVLVVWRRRAR